MTSDERNHVIWILRFGAPVYMELQEGRDQHQWGWWGDPRRKLMRRPDGAYGAEACGYDGSPLLVCESAEDLVYAYENWGARLVEVARDPAGAAGVPSP